MVHNSSTLNRFARLALIGLAFLALLVPALAGAQSDSSPVLAHWELVTSGDDDSGGDYVTTAVAGRPYVLKLIVEPREHGAELKWSLAANVNVACMYSPVYGISDQTGFQALWDVQIRHDAQAGTCEIAGGQINYVLNGVDGSMTVDTLTIGIIPRAFGTISLVSPTGENVAVAGTEADFMVALISNDGPLSFSNTYLDFTCTNWEMKDFYVAVEEGNLAQAIGFFHATMPPTANHCRMEGTFVANGDTYQLLTLEFDVKVGPQFAIQLTCPAVVLPSVKAKCNVQINQTGADATYSTRLLLDGNPIAAEAPFNQQTIFFLNTLPAGTTHTVAAQVIKKGQSAPVASEQVQIRVAATGELIPSAYAPLVTLNISR